MGDRAHGFTAQVHESRGQKQAHIVPGNLTPTELTFELRLYGKRNAESVSKRANESGANVVTREFVAWTWISQAHDQSDGRHPLVVAGCVLSGALCRRITLTFRTFTFARLGFTFELFVHNLFNFFLDDSRYCHTRDH